MANKECPLCGAFIDDDQYLCNNCTDNTQKRDSLQFSVDNEDDSTTADQLLSENIEQQPQEVLSEKNEDNKTDSISPKKKTPKNNKKFLICLSLTVSILCVAIGIIYVQQDNKKKAHKAELDFWYSCIEQNTPLEYSKYLLVYPNGEFNKEAHLKITELRKIEHDKWETLKKSNNIDEYYSFLGAYPESPFKNEISKIIDSLSWEKATSENTAESYLFYIENARLGNISGYYKAMAEEKHQYLSQIKELSKEESDIVIKTLETFFKTLSKQQFKDLPELFNGNISNFYGATNRPSNIIVKSIQSDMDKNKIKSLIYAPDFSTINSYKDGKNIYVINLNINKKITYKGKKTTESIDEVLQVEITPEMRIKALYPPRKAQQKE